MSGELAGERVLVVCAERGRLHAFRNTCRRSPHALVSERKGRLQSAIRCVTHALTYTFDGQLVEGQTPGDLTPLELTRRGRLLLVRAAPAVAALSEGSMPAEAFDGLYMRAVSERDVAADWKVIVEQWLENPQPQQHFVAPNQLFIVHPGSATILQVLPSAPGAGRVRRFEFARGGRRSSRAAHATDCVARRAAGARAVHAEWSGERASRGRGCRAGHAGAGRVSRHDPGVAARAAGQLNRAGGSGRFTSGMRARRRSWNSSIQVSSCDSGPGR